MKRAMGWMLLLSCCVSIFACSNRNALKLTYTETATHLMDLRELGVISAKENVEVVTPALRALEFAASDGDKASFDHIYQQLLPYIARVRPKPTTQKAGGGEMLALYVVFALLRLAAKYPFVTKVLRGEPLTPEEQEVIDDEFAAMRTRVDAQYAKDLDELNRG
jgi:hypothetical protein